MSEEVKDKRKEFVHLAFAYCGLFSTFLSSVILTGTQDILAGTNIPTTTVLMAGIIPFTAIDVIAPYFIKRISNVILVSVTVINISTGLLILAHIEQVEWKITAAGFATSGVAIGTITIISLTSNFEPSVVSAYSTGTGIGFLGGPLYYTALTTWLRVSPMLTLAILSPVTFSFCVSSYVISENKGNKTTWIKEKCYTSIKHTDEEEVNNDDTNEERDEKGQGHEHGQSTKTTNNGFLTGKEKLLIIAKLFSLALVPSFISFVSQYLLTQSIVTTISFKNSPFRPRDHYLYYYFVFSTGEMLGRCHRSLISFFNVGCLYTPNVLSVWLLSAIVVMVMFFAFFESWYRFLPNVGVLISLCFIAGISQGMLFNNMLELLHLKFEGHQREFVMGYACLPRGFGPFAAALIGLYVEPRLLAHCISIVTDSDLCLTRSV